MAYSTKADIQKVLSDATLAQLTDHQNGTTIDDTKITQAIDDADELIDAYLRGRYTLPFSSTPTVVKQISVDIAIFNLYSKRPEREMPETIRTRYRDALRLLADIQSGKATLADASGVVAEPGEYTTNKTDDDRVFTKELLDQMP